MGLSGLCGWSVAAPAGNGDIGMANLCSSPEWKCGTNTGTRSPQMQMGAQGVYLGDTGQHAR
eukprot:12903099-Prorocentrum_lima.AAC.1